MLVIFVFGILIISIKAFAMESPCPEQFHYEYQKPGEWSGTLNLLSDSELFGIWLRIHFDKPPKDIYTLNDNFKMILIDNNDILLKGPGIHLKANSLKHVTIVVKFDDNNEIPKLIGYRLNAKVVCPESDTILGEIYENDFESTDLIESIGLFNQNRSVNNCEKKLINTIDKNFPWQANLLTLDNRFICDATLISENYLITPAHCVTRKNNNKPINKRNLKILLNKNDDSNIDNDNDGILNVKNITLYPGYHSGSLLNDLALIQLDKAIKTKPICLSDNQQEENDSYIIGSSFINNKLNDIKWNLVNKKFCKNIQIDNIICVNYLTNDDKACVGLSGSALISKGSEGGYLKGIVMLSIASQHKYECNQASDVVLLDISKYAKWIYSNIQ